jgi:hypothetical protein
VVKPLADRYLNLVDPFYHFISEQGSGRRVKEGLADYGHSGPCKNEEGVWLRPFGLS